MFCFQHETAGTWVLPCCSLSPAHALEKHRVGCSVQMIWKQTSIYNVSSKRAGVLFCSLRCPQHLESEGHTRCSLNMDWMCELGMPHASHSFWCFMDIFFLIILWIWSRFPPFGQKEIRIRNTGTFHSETQICLKDSLQSLAKSGPQPVSQAKDGRFFFYIKRVMEEKNPPQLRLYVASTA